MCGFTHYNVLLVTPVDKWDLTQTLLKYMSQKITIRASGLTDLCSGFLCSGFGRSGSYVRGSYVRGSTPNVRIRTFGVFGRWGFLCSGFNPERPNMKTPNVRFWTLKISDVRGSTPNVRIWRFIVFGHSGFNPERPKMAPPTSEPRTSENEPRTPKVRKWTPNPECPKINPHYKNQEHKPRTSYHRT